MIFLGLGVVLVLLKIYLKLPPPKSNIVLQQFFFLENHISTSFGLSQRPTQTRVYLLNVGTQIPIARSIPNLHWSFSKVQWREFTAQFNIWHLNFKIIIGLWFFSMQWQKRIIQKATGRHFFLDGTGGLYDTL